MVTYLLITQAAHIPTITNVNINRILNRRSYPIFLLGNCLRLVDHHTHIHVSSNAYRGTGSWCKVNTLYMVVWPRSISLAACTYQRVSVPCIISTVIHTRNKLVIHKYVTYTCYCRHCDEHLCWWIVSATNMVVSCLTMSTPWCNPCRHSFRAPLCTLPRTYMVKHQGIYQQDIF